jgi:hypothetical protein
MRASLTLHWNWFHEFQPSGGRRASPFSEARAPTAARTTTAARTIRSAAGRRRLLN